METTDEAIFKACTYSDLSDVTCKFPIESENRDSICQVRHSCGQAHQVKMQICNSSGSSLCSTKDNLKAHHLLRQAPFIIVTIALEYLTGLGFKRQTGDARHAALLQLDIQVCGVDSSASHGVVFLATLAASPTVAPLL